MLDALLLSPLSFMVGVGMFGCLGLGATKKKTNIALSFKR